MEMTLAPLKGMYLNCWQIGYSDKNFADWQEKFDAFIEELKAHASDDLESEMFLAIRVDLKEKSRLRAFFTTPEEKKVQLGGRFVLHGYVYGNEDFPNGDLIHTSNVLKIERVGVDRQVVGPDGVLQFRYPGEVFKATTLSFHEYYLHRQAMVDAKRVENPDDIIHQYYPF